MQKSPLAEISDPNPLYLSVSGPFESALQDGCLGHLDADSGGGEWRGVVIVALDLGWRRRRLFHDHRNPWGTLHYADDGCTRRIFCALAPTHTHTLCLQRPAAFSQLNDAERRTRRAANFREASNALRQWIGTRHTQRCGLNSMDWLNVCTRTHHRTNIPSSTRYLQLNWRLSFRWKNMLRLILVKLSRAKMLHNKLFIEFCDKGSEIALC
jgi:hypothetical protein